MTAGSPHRGFSTLRYIALCPRAAREKSMARTLMISAARRGVRATRRVMRLRSDTARRVVPRIAGYWIWIWSITAVAEVTVDDESLAVTTSLSVPVLPANADRSMLLRAVKLDSVYDVNPEIDLASTT